MSKKKSYMNKNTLVTEGFFSKLSKVLGLSSSQEKKLKKKRKMKENNKKRRNEKYVKKYS